MAMHVLAEAHLIKTEKLRAKSIQSFTFLLIGHVRMRLDTSRHSQLDLDDVDTLL